VASVLIDVHKWAVLLEGIEADERKTHDGGSRRNRARRGLIAEQLLGTPGNV
jgi:hypothetical protein